MKSFLDKKDPWGHGMSLWVVAALVFAAPLVFVSLKGIRLDNDVQSWLPDEDHEAQVFGWSTRHFPERERVLVSWEGSSLHDPRIDRFAEKLTGTAGVDGVVRGGVPYIESVFTPLAASQRMAEQGVEPGEALRRLNGVLIGSGWMKVRLSDAGREDRDRTIEMIVANIAAETGITVTVHEALVDYVDEQYFREHDAAMAAQESTGVAAAENELLATYEMPAHDLQLSWPTMQAKSDTSDKIAEVAKKCSSYATADYPDGRDLVEDCFFVSGSPLALAVTLSEAGVADFEASVDAIREAAIASGVPEEKLHLGGRPVTTSSLNEEVRRSAWNPAAPWWRMDQRSILLLSGAVGVILAFVFLRSLRLGLLVVGVSYYATAVSISLIPLTGASMNMVLVVMPTLLMVLSLSSAIHVANYWKYAAAEDSKSAVQHALAMAKQPCTLAAITTAIGLFSLYSSALRPVKDFGVYSAVGCVVALVVVLYGLPALLQIWGTTPPKARAADGRAWRGFGVALYRWKRPVMIGSLILCAVGAYGLKHFRTETKVVRYFPQDSRLSKDYDFLEQSLSGISPVDVVVRFDHSAQETTRFLERVEIVRQVSDSLRQHPEISGTISLADFMQVSEPLAEDASKMAKVGYFRRSQAAENKVKDPENLGSKSFVVTASEDSDIIGPDGQPLNRAGDELWKITAQAAVMSDIPYSDLNQQLHSAIQSVTKMHPGTTHVVTGSVPLFLRTQEAVLESLIYSFVMAFVLIAGMMIYVVKDFWAGLISMVPNILPVATVFGVISWMGERVDVGTMITASVALGIAVDGTLHLITWYIHGLQMGQSRMRAVVESLARCGPAMWQTSAAIGVGLLVLYPANLLLISRFGWLMASLIGAALAADLILLPALLSGWLGALIERRVQRMPRPVVHVTHQEAVTVDGPPHISLTTAIQKTREAG
ncbi:MAG: MMPL family transporter [Planctomycetaceae bacterium]